MKDSRESDSRKIISVIVKYIFQGLAILIPVVLPFFSSPELSTDMKLSTIGAGISISLLILGISMNSLEKGIKENNENTLKELDSISKEISQVNPVMEKVLISDNERLKRFAFRRYSELTKTINTALNNGDSGILRTSEYYEELFYLADLILQDKIDNKQKFSGEIWAMTGFEENEWIPDDGYENIWTEKLKDLAREKIQTKRLCLIPYEVEMIIKNFSSNENYEKKRFMGFIKMLKDYYCDEEIKKVTKHYMIKESASAELKTINGFFAIKLTNGDLHILYGETGDSNGAITARVLFNSNEIEKVHDLFELFTVSSNLIENKIREWSNGNDFINYLQNQNIKI